jgi:hypothetical protein
MHKLPCLGKNKLHADRVGTTWKPHVERLQFFCDSHAFGMRFFCVTPTKLRLLEELKLGTLFTLARGAKNTTT